MHCTSRLFKGLDDRRPNPKFGGAVTKILVSSQIAQQCHLRPVWASESLSCFPLGIRVFPLAKSNIITVLTCFVKEGDVSLASQFRAA